MSKIKKNEKKKVNAIIETNIVVTQTEIPHPAVNIMDEHNVIESKKYVKGRIAFDEPKNIIMRFVELLSQFVNTVVIKGSHEVINKNVDNSENIAYGRFSVIADLSVAESIFYRVGFMYAYDLAIPKFKMFRGANVQACNNQCVFNDEDCVTIALTSDDEFKYAEKYMAEIGNHIKTISDTINSMITKTLTIQESEHLIGKMIFRQAEKLRPAGTNSIMYAVDQLINPKSVYYIKQPNFSLWTLYNAITEYHTKSNIWDIPEKALDTFKMLKYEK